MLLLTLEQQLKLLDLYVDEICARIASNLNISLNPLDKLLHADELERVLDNETKDNKEKAMNIWQMLNKSAMKDHLYSAVLQFLKEDEYHILDGELHSSLCIERYSPEVLPGLRRMLNNTDAFINAICISEEEVRRMELEIEEMGQWEQFARALRLSSISNDEFRKLVKPVCKRVRERRISILRAVKHLLRSITEANPNGFEHLLCALDRSGIRKGQIIVHKIHPNFQREYDNIISTSRNSHLRSHIGLEPIIDFMDIRPIRIRPFMPPMHMRASVIDLCHEVPIDLRPYQRELAAEACQGLNVIICAPTGSGKTVVAAYIIREHMCAAMREEGQARICFIVPTAALVEQQKILFKKYLGKFASVRGLVGGSGEKQSLNNPAQPVIECADIVVITPQLLVNLLNESKSESCVKPFSLDHFSLIVFDESHHSKDNHPYNELMAHYHEMKLNGAHRGDNPPQIIGMTASIGIGGSSSKNLTDAIQYILEICANMDAEYISFVRENIESLREFMPPVAEAIQFVDGKFYEPPHPYNAILEQLMFIRSQLLNVPEAATDVEVAEKLNDRNSRDPHQQAFENWLCTLRSDFLSKTRKLCDNSRQHLNFCVEQLLVLYYAIDFLNLFGPESAFFYILREEKELMKLRAEETLKGQISGWVTWVYEFKETVHSVQPNSPLLDKLIEIVNDQFRWKADSRVLIFLKQRDQCELLSRLLNKKTQHRTSFFTGKSSKDEAGQNAQVQRATLDDFRLGNTSILCATTVAEEGIDISACNLIIHYNYVTNEIARVQRRGRGRAKDARSVLLTSEEWIKEKEEQNMIREQLMKNALDELAKKPRAEIKGKVDKLVSELNTKRRQRLAEERARLERRRGTPAPLFRVVCKHCSNFLGLSKHIAVVDGCQYVMADPEFWKRTEVGPLSQEKRHSRATKIETPNIGEHRCSCGQKLGRVLQKDSILLPNLSAEKIAFVQCKADGSEKADAQRSSKRQWRKVNEELFLVNKITQLQLAEMRQAPVPQFMLLNIN